MVILKKRPGTRFDGMREASEKKQKKKKKKRTTSPRASRRITRRHRFRNHLTIEIAWWGELRKASLPNARADTGLHVGDECRTRRACPWRGVASWITSGRGYPGISIRHRYGARKPTERARVEKTLHGLFAPRRRTYLRNRTIDTTLTRARRVQARPPREVVQIRPGVPYVLRSRLDGTSAP